MSRTSFSDKCNILGEFWLHYREDAEQNESWGDFFSYSDISPAWAQDRSGAQM